MAAPSSSTLPVDESVGVASSAGAHAVETGTHAPPSVASALGGAGAAAAPPAPEGAGAGVVSPPAAAAAARRSAAPEVIDEALVALLKRDFKRFQGLHSWYKHLPLAGTPFYTFLDVGEQHRNGIHSEVSDSVNRHWHFIEAEYRASADRGPFRKFYGPFNLGAFLRGVEGSAEAPYLQNIPSEMQRGVGHGEVHEKFRVWLTEKHPDLDPAKFAGGFSRDMPEIYELFRREETKYWNDVLRAVQTT